MAATESDRVRSAVQSDPRFIVLTFQVCRVNFGVTSDRDETKGLI